MREPRAKVGRVRGPAMRGLVAVLALTTLAGCTPLDDAMVAVFGRSMRDQRSFDPYENPRPDPENARAFAGGNWPSEPTGVNVGQPAAVDIPYFTQSDLGVPGVGGPVVQRLENPFSWDEGLERGEEIYLRYCVVCHGEDGVGGNAYIIDYHPLLASYNLSGEQVAGYSDGYLYAMIRVGRGLMPKYGARITHFDRWRVVNYVRQLQQQAGTLPEQAAAEAAEAQPEGPDHDGEDR